jgi:hypothetical protein
VATGLRKTATKAALRERELQQKEVARQVTGHCKVVPRGGTRGERRTRVPKGTKVACHVTGHRKAVPRGGTRKGITQVGVEGRGINTAEDDSDGGDNVPRRDKNC